MMYGEKSFRHGDLDDLKVFSNKGSRMSVLRGSFPSENYGHRNTRYALCAGLTAGDRPCSDNYVVLKASELKALHDLLGRMIDAGEVVDEVSETEYKKCCDDVARRRWLRNHRHGFSVRYE